MPCLRILVTGGCGFIGQHLVNSLISDGSSKEDEGGRKNGSQQPGHHVVVADNLSNGTRKNPFSKKSGVVYYNKDVRDSDAISRIIKREKIDTCIHLAAKVIYSSSKSDAIEVFDVNVKGTLSVLKACHKNHVGRFVFASSAATYGDAQTMPTPETHSLNPLTIYGATKAAAEMLVRSFRNSGKIKSTTTLRLFNVYGKGQSMPYAGVISRFAEQLSNGGSPIIYGDGTQTRDFVSVRDIVKCILLAIKPDAPSGTFNVGTGRAISINQLAMLMARYFGIQEDNLACTYKALRGGDIKHSCADVSTLRRYFGYVPEASLKADLEELLGRRQQEIPITNLADNNRNNNAKR